MEKSQTESSRTPFCFRSRRKSHLKSQTYLTSARILSQCYNHPQLCQTARIVPQELRPDNHINEPEEASEKEVHEHNELVTPHGMDHDNSPARRDVSVHENDEAMGFKDEGFSDTQTVIHEIENIMNTEEDEDPSKQKNLTVDDGTNGTGLQDTGFFQLQQLLMDELDVMKGNEEVAKDKNSNLTTMSLGENLCCGELNDQEEHFDLQPIFMPECRSAGEQQVDKDHSRQNTFGTIDSSVVKSMTCEVSKLSDNNEDNISLLRTNELGTDVEIQQKEMDLGQSDHISGAEGFSNHMIEDGEMEEGEIPGEFEVSDRLVMSCVDSALPQDQRKQLSEDIDRSKFPFNDKQEENEKDFGSISITVDVVDKTTTRGEAEADDFRNDMVCKRKVVDYGDPILVEEPDRHKKQKKSCETKKSRKVSGAKEKKKGDADCRIVSSNNSPIPTAAPAKSIVVSSIQNSDQTTTGDQGIMSKEMSQDAGVRNKKKRGPPSEERKAKKKEKKRKKRAQKNRELGVKRLKLRPVQNPKPVAYCRHYVKGRCQEGEKCKFSHDTTPLTKSKPCCHFARHSCLKGDDCPFDHQLSKYPCTNFVSTGFCSRGKDCLFSHKLPLKEDLPSATNVCTPGSKPPSLPGTSNSKKQLDSGETSHHSTKASPDNVGLISCNTTVQNVAKSVLTTPVLAPKCTSFLSAGKSSIGEFSHSTPSSSSLKRNEGFKNGNKADQSPSETIQNLNDLPKGISPVMAPKGINFLSFGKSPLEYSRTKNITGNGGSKLFLSNNFSLHKQSTPNMGNGVQVSKDSTESVSGTALWLNRMLHKNEFAAASLRSNILSFGESADGSISSRQGSLPSSSGASVDRSVQESKILPNVHQNSSVISQGQQNSPLSSSQSADFLAHACLKNTPKSAQKALISTLAFAAKFESEMNMKQSTSGALAVSKATNNENGDRDGGACSSSQNDSVNALKILDFLSGVSGKMKQ